MSIRSELTRALAGITLWSVLLSGCHDSAPKNRLASIDTRFHGIHLGDSVTTVFDRIGVMNPDPNGRHAGSANTTEEEYEKLGRVRDYYQIPDRFITRDEQIVIDPTLYFASFLDGRLVDFTLSGRFMIDKSEFTPELAFNALSDYGLKGLRWLERPESGVEVHTGVYAYHLLVDTTGEYPIVKYSIWYRWFREEFDT
jgi:hypothetical protein